MTETTIKYKCACMVEEASLSVRCRQRNEDIAHWMRHIVQHKIGHDHARRSPACTRTEMEYAAIHLPEAAPGIGMKPEIQ